ncbi:MAG: hypothetical protein PVH00_15765 [Gemmatimonadota bacterium]
MPRLRTALLVAALGCATAGPAAAQRRANFALPRIYVSGWAGRFTTFGGFSDDQDTYFRFDDATAFGGSLHVRAGQTALLGVDVVYASPNYDRFNNANPPDIIASDHGRTIGAVLSTRLSGSGGMAGVYVTGGAGGWFWDLPELDGWQFDPTLMAGAGLDYALRRQFTLFGEYAQWWVYHEKSGDVVKNTANHTLIRFGLRLAF